MNEFSLCRYTINKHLNEKKVSGIGIGIGIGYRRYSKQSIGIGIVHHGIVPSLGLIDRGWSIRLEVGLGKGGRIGPLPNIFLTTDLITEFRLDIHAV